MILISLTQRRRDIFLFSQITLLPHIGMWTFEMFLKEGRVSLPCQVKKIGIHPQSPDTATAREEPISEERRGIGKGGESLGRDGLVPCEFSPPKSNIPARGRSEP